jgi:hypothetical protein
VGKPSEVGGSFRGMVNARAFRAAALLKSETLFHLSNGVKARR